MTMRLKTAQEIKILREGGKRHAEILFLLARQVKPGISTMILEEEALRLIREGGDKPAHLGYKPRGAKRPFPAALCLSINDEIVHGIPNENIRLINEGDIVSIDLSLEHDGLITDSAITVPCGVIDDESQRLLDITREALYAGIQAAKPGNTIGDIGEAISDTVKPSGFSIADDLMGHGVGFEIHEEPYVPNFDIGGKGEKLVPGLVIAIEPMVNIGSSAIKDSSDGYTIKTRDGSRSAHFEHTVAITEKGNIILTS
ncbi:MAG: type I methionyl aminopeptidase [Candidatus Zambryskibacteria bacterium RIFCSPHIGHO2_02_FULL_43_14]|uniref:Methionine aminopeptidase n=1 Tax=Candidatus Zambryskibacteria bacterium RIFCSPHIGHO2_02_FULL_43_14 TaxID=1802748 RepID=A0A1G2TFE2_9BACT|nr:MAG: type I methionyl aminopeptidase [Candidatus Zambryskibacteria bacterium RIFCSPHIGHO2_01_FULL_43_60]OHA96014.1 MAG: type I methionyl aminopeptidase [Candidatus Zambryskibacteria bacterium RIFCSPHIGHO2_02_FULL_43_14]OHB03099.1 MAG: type I methionyl aminopeptidase [Candidatus Zambryskibacteria bacterium RIFCSPLOWO2_01_FULL_42_41]